MAPEQVTARGDRPGGRLVRRGRAALRGAHRAAALRRGAAPDPHGEAAQSAGAAARASPRRPGRSRGALHELLALRACGAPDGTRGAADARVGRSATAQTEPSRQTRTRALRGARRRDSRARRRRLRESRRGPAVVVLVDGESGVGKSCLVRPLHRARLGHAARRHRALGPLLRARVRCRTRRFDGVVDALARLPASAARRAGLRAPALRASGRWSRSSPCCAGRRRSRSP